MKLANTSPGTLVRTRMMIILLIALLLMLPAGDSSSGSTLPSCEWCGAAEAPARLGSELVLAKGEPGEPLVIEGRVVRAGGRTPVPGVLLYVYHTNARGIYPKKGDETGNARRHGYLRGWLRTDEQGRYRILTIRPGTYPTRTEAAHIHMTVTERGGKETWIDSIMFEDDALLTREARGRLQGRGGSGVIRLTRDESGTWRGRRDIILPAE
ncbi:MAG TPA: intradiol ring-cleavage dioxygenase [Thermoanaerobaculia bacterium]|nr:intradiol ring-cleavage dioxygenase [Thermoanaerobaculia bacterium]